MNDCLVDLFTLFTIPQLLQLLISGFVPNSLCLAAETWTILPSGLVAVFSSNFSSPSLFRALPSHTHFHAHTHTRQIDIFVRTCVFSLLNTLKAGESQFTKKAMT